MITLQVPDGFYCDGCMFLSKGVRYEAPRCALFNYVTLDHCVDYDDCADIRKCEQCPKSDTESEEAT